MSLIYLIPTEETSSTYSFLKKWYHHFQLVANEKKPNCIFLNICYSLFLIRSKYIPSWWWFRYSTLSPIVYKESIVMPKHKMTSKNIWDIHIKMFRMCAQHFSLKFMRRKISTKYSLLDEPRPSRSFLEIMPHEWNYLSIYRRVSSKRFSHCSIFSIAV